MSRAGVIIIGQTIGEKPQHDRAKRVNIHAGIRFPGAKISRFGRHESWSANQSARALIGIHWIKRGARNSEINHFHNRFVGIKRNKNVGWLEIAMNNAALMGVMNRAANLRHEIHALTK